MRNSDRRITPFLENMNIIFEFSSYVKNVLEYYANGIGEKPKLGLSEIKNFKDFLTVTAGDNNGEMTIGAISKGNKCNIFNNCTFNFREVIVHRISLSGMKLKEDR